MESYTVGVNTDDIKYDTVVIYHAGCADGLAAAWSFRQTDKFGPIHFHHAFERSFKKDKKFPDINNKDVYIVDYSYPRDELIAMRSVAKSLTILDHHKTAMADLTPPIDGVNTIFDMKKCGAEITWEFLHGDTPAPWWLHHIRDRDLWDWKYTESKYFSAMLSDMGICFESLDAIDAISEEERIHFYNKGKSLIEFQNKEIIALCKFAQLVMFENQPVFAVNSVRYRSEIGSELAARPECKFSFVYRHDINTNEWWISLRGKGGIDLGIVAKKYGGGGHPDAAGFSYKGNIYDILTPINHQ